MDIYIITIILTLNDYIMDLWWMRCALIWHLNFYVANQIWTIHMWLMCFYNDCFIFLYIPYAVPLLLIRYHIHHNRISSDHPLPLISISIGTPEISCTIFQKSYFNSLKLQISLSKQSLSSLSLSVPIFLTKRLWKKHIHLVTVLYTKLSKWQFPRLHKPKPVSIQTTALANNTYPMENSNSFAQEI